jgi:hypothetical protein
MKIYVFGDSWVAGCELGRFVTNGDTGADYPELAFPKKIEDLTKINVINLGETASSQPSIIEKLRDCDISVNDIAIFCLTAKTRRIYRLPNGDFYEQQYNEDEKLCNPYEDERVSSQTCALLYYMTKERLAHPLFLNLFDSVRYGDKTYNEIPNDCWLIPKTQSVVSYLYDTEFFSTWDHHHAGNFRDWLRSNRAQPKNYIQPCEAHPNINGHTLIAEFIVNELHRRNLLVS